MSFQTVLVANRGEIAVRVLKTAAQLGFRTVAVYSEADADAPHVALADVSVCIGPAPSASSYLDPERLLDAARRSGAEAIHPGYGFLSENAAFAQAVLDAGLVWIGPPPDAIAAMGDKAAAKALMEQAGVPCVPGFRGKNPSDEELMEAAAEVGYPLLVKASAGGGGRGMRRVHSREALPDALRTARSEAKNAFGDDALLLERLVEGARHIEIQVFADAHGNVLHLGERDCSVQRRHQKVIEEAPAVPDEWRNRMGEVACRAARAVDYVGAGTVELLLEPGGDFWFLEMNTRLQVEHPVTEEVTGLDLVALQLRVAAGEPLPFTQADVTLSGHAIEARLYAEDPAQDYRPQPGDILLWEPPPGIRVDAGLPRTGTLHPHYDPMVAKLIATGRTREEARRRLLRALEQTVFFGVQTNRDLLTRVLEHPTFVAGQATTEFLDQTPALTSPGPDDPHVLLAGLAALRGDGDGFRSAHALEQPMSVDVDGQRVDALWTADGVSLDTRFGPTEGLDGGTPAGARSIETAEAGPRVVRPVALLGTGLWRRVVVGGLSKRVQVFRHAGAVHVRSGTTSHVLRPWDFAPKPVAPGLDGRITLPMAGRVVRVEVAAGDRVTAGQVVAVIEAMKLENRLLAAVDGVVAEVLAAPGDVLATGALLVRLALEESP